MREVLVVPARCRPPAHSCPVLLAGTQLRCLMPVPIFTAVLFMVAQGLSSTGGAGATCLQLPPSSHNCCRCRRACMLSLTTSSFLSFLILLRTDFIITKLLGTPKDTMLAQVRMCLVTAVFSSFVNDTPVVSARGCKVRACWQLCIPLHSTATGAALLTVLSVAAVRGWG